MRKCLTVFVAMATAANLLATNALADDQEQGGVLMYQSQSSNGTGTQSQEVAVTGDGTVIATQTMSSSSDDDSLPVRWVYTEEHTGLRISVIETIMAHILIKENLDDDIWLDTYINTMTRDEQQQLLSAMEDRLSQYQAKLNELTTLLSKTNERSLSVLRKVRNTALAISVGLTGFTALSQTLEVMHKFNMEAKESRLRRLRLGERLNPEEIQRIQEVSVYRNGEYVPSFSKIFGRHMKNLMSFRRPAGTRIYAARAASVAMAVAFGVTIVSEVAIAAIPESAGDRDLLNNVDALKLDINRLQTVADAVRLSCVVRGMELRLEK